MFLLSLAVYAIPPIGMEMYGDVTINGTGAPKGTVITVHDGSGKMCGAYIVQEEGSYGLLSCTGDDYGTSRDEGAVMDEELFFMVSDMPAYTTERVKWKEGALKKIGLAVYYMPTAQEPIETQSAQTGLLLIVFGLLVSAVLLIILMSEHI